MLAASSVGRTADPPRRAWGSTGPHHHDHREGVWLLVSRARERRIEGLSHHVTSVSPGGRRGRCRTSCAPRSCRLRCGSHARYCGVVLPCGPLRPRQPWSRMCRTGAKPPSIELLQLPSVWTRVYEPFCHPRLLCVYVMTGPANTPSATATAKRAANTSMISAPCTRDGGAPLQGLPNPASGFVPVGSARDLRESSIASALPLGPL